MLKFLRSAAEFRNNMNKEGLTDNAGAIHCVERILDLLSYRIKYPGLTHVRQIRNYDGAEFSKEALIAFRQKRSVVVEHVAPQRDFATRIISQIAAKKSDTQLKNYIKRHYRLVLLTQEESALLNRINRSKMHKDRLGQAGIKTVSLRKKLR